MIIISSIAISVVTVYFWVKYICGARKVLLEIPKLYESDYWLI